VHSFDQIGRVVDVKTVFHFYPETRGTTLLRLYFLQLFQDLSSAPVIYNTYIKRQNTLLACKTVDSERKDFCMP